MTSLAVPDRENPRRYQRVDFGVDPNNNAVEIIAAAPTGQVIGVHGLWFATNLALDWALQSNSVASFDSTPNLGATTPISIGFQEYPFYMGADGSSVQILSSTVGVRLVRGFAVFVNYPVSELLYQP